MCMDICELIDISVDIYIQYTYTVYIYIQYVAISNYRGHYSPGHYVCSLTNHMN